MSISDFNKLHKKQGYKCAICGNKKGGKRREILSIDHDHKIGNIRGLLCNNCNSLLGHAHDSIKILNKAINYLRKHAKTYYS